MEVGSGVETLSSKLKEKHSVYVIQHKSKKQTNQTNKDNRIKTDTLSSKTDNIVNLRKLQNEIMKFTTHFDAQDNTAKKQLAIKLGAKPKKKDCINYKQLKQKLKQEADLKKNQEQLFKLPKTMVRTSKNNNKKINLKKNKNSTDIIKNYGTIRIKKK